MERPFAVPLRSSTCPRASSCIPIRPDAARVIEVTGADPHWLDLEITEHSMMQYEGHHRELFQKIAGTRDFRSMTSALGTLSSAIWSSIPSTG